MKTFRKLSFVKFIWKSYLITELKVISIRPNSINFVIWYFKIFFGDFIYFFIILSETPNIL